MTDSLSHTDTHTRTHTAFLCESRHAGPGQLPELPWRQGDHTQSPPAQERLRELTEHRDKCKRLKNEHNSQGPQREGVRAGGNCVPVSHSVSHTHTHTHTSRGRSSCFTMSDLGRAGGVKGNKAPSQWQAPPRLERGRRPLPTLGNRPATGTGEPEPQGSDEPDPGLATRTHAQA